MESTFLKPNDVYALIIGINIYPDRPDIDWWSLSGAVSDAQRFETYLVQNLKVPQHHVRLMVNSTRQEMVEAFRALQQGLFPNRNRGTSPIPKDSAFILFYAGHGGRCEIPSCWGNYRTPDMMVEQLIPSDIGEVDFSGNVVEGIPDRVVSSVLRGLMQNIGDNVTVIFDCCHSAGQTRAPSAHGQSPQLARRMRNLPPITGAFDKDLLDNVAQKDTGVMLNRGMRGSIYSETPKRAGRAGDSSDKSYILLAACQQDQYAFDSPGGGLFTKELLKVLTAHRIDDLTYAGLMLRIKTDDPRQTPACFGVNQNRVIFTSKQGKPSEDCFIGEIYPERPDRLLDNDPIVHGGTVHGIKEGDEFELFDITPEQKPFGKAIVKQVSPLRSRLYLDNAAIAMTDCTTFYCRLIRDPAALRVYCDVSNKNLCDELIRTGFTPADSHIKADVVISDINRYPSYVKMVLQLDEPLPLPESNESADDYGYIGTLFEDLYTQMSRWWTAPEPHKLYQNEFGRKIDRNDTVDLRETLMAASRFLSLWNIPESVPQGWENIDISFHRVTAAPSERKNNSQLYHSSSKQFCHSLLPEYKREISITVAKNKQRKAEREFYGMTIKNQSSQSLFAYVLSLEPNDLKIVPWYSSTYHTPEVPMYEDREHAVEVAAGIKPWEELYIGHENGGVPPCSFSLTSDQDIEQSYLKIILTTSPADFSMLMQIHDTSSKSYTRTEAMTRSTTARANIFGGGMGEEFLPRAREKQKLLADDLDYFAVTLIINQSPAV